MKSEKKEETKIRTKKDIKTLKVEPVKEAKVKKKHIISFEKILRKINPQKAKFNSIEIVLLSTMTLVFGILLGELFFHNTTQPNSYNTEIDKVYDTLIREYNDTIDPLKLSDAAIKGMMDFLEDKYSVYFSEEETNDFYEELNGTFIGIGVEMALGEDKVPKIIRVLENSPAEKAGLKENDKFLKVEGIDVSASTLSELSRRIKGKTYKTLTLTLEREGEEIEKKITTGEIELTSVTSNIYEKNNKKIGYIYISIFAANTDEQFKKELQKLESQNIDSLIIDVRSNPGGHLDTVTNILNTFLNKSQVLYQLKDGNEITKIYGETNNVKNYNIAVLIDSASASASEVLTSALKEVKKAEVIGKTTYGKGTVQTTMILSSGSMVKYTNEEWLTSNGNSINEVGVSPTYEIELNTEYFTDYSDAKDNQLQKAIEVLGNK